MELSARNQLPATVKSVQLGGIMAEVVLELEGGSELVAAVTRGSAEHLELTPGRPLFAVV